MRVAKFGCLGGVTLLAISRFGSAAELSPQQIYHARWRPVAAGDLGVTTRPMRCQSHHAVASDGSETLTQGAPTQVFAYDHVPALERSARLDPVVGNGQQNGRIDSSKVGLWV